MAQDEFGPNPLGEDARLRELDERLRAAGHAEAKRSGQVPEADASYRLGNRVLAELLGGLIGGALIGWTIDRFAGTSPWGLLVVLALGVIVAFRNIIRISGERPE